MNLDAADPIGLATNELRRLSDVVKVDLPVDGKLRDALALLGTSIGKSLIGRKQLSFADSFEELRGARHTRFDHVIGVMTKVYALIAKIRAKKGHGVVSEEEELDTLIAACLHDAGHLPYSHPTERALMSAAGDGVKGLKHEERICRLLLTGAAPWEDVWRVLFEDLKLDWPRVMGVCWRIDWDYMERLRGQNPNRFGGVRPKRCLARMISSTLDMDRLDYVVRDAEAIGYQPVLAIKDDLLKLLNYYDVVEVLNEEGGNEVDLELCIEEGGLGYAFSLLVARLMLYKYIYFSEDLRAVEGSYARLVSQLYHHRGLVDPLEVMDMSDTGFLKYLESVIEDLPESVDRALLRHDLETCRDSHGRYERIMTIRPVDVAHEPDREIFKRNVWNLEFLSELSRRIVDVLKDNSEGVADIGVRDVLCDGLRIRPEKGGTFWVRMEDGGFQALAGLVNGSNIHGLIEELSIDVYFDRTKARRPGIREALRAAVRRVLRLRE